MDNEIIYCINCNKTHSDWFDSETIKELSNYVEESILCRWCAYTQPKDTTGYILDNGKWVKKEKKGK